jgi:hypothetical protein
LVLPPEVLRLPDDLARVVALLDDPVFFAPLVPYFHPVLGRPRATLIDCALDGYQVSMLPVAPISTNLNGPAP